MIGFAGIRVGETDVAIYHCFERVVEGSVVMGGVNSGGERGSKFGVRLSIKWVDIKTFEVEGSVCQEISEKVSNYAGAVICFA